MPSMSDDNKIVREVEVGIEDGLHMRPAMQFVDCACQYDSQVTISDGDKHVDGKSIMQVTMLAATKGTKLTITTEGNDAVATADALTIIITGQDPGELKF